MLQIYTTKNIKTWLRIFAKQNSKKFKDYFRWRVTGKSIVTNINGYLQLSYEKTMKICRTLFLRRFLVNKWRCQYCSLFFPFKNCQTFLPHNRKHKRCKTNYKNISRGLKYNFSGKCEKINKTYSVKENQYVS